MSGRPATVPPVTEPSYLAAIRESYDTVAVDYVKCVPSEPDALGRAMLAAFVEFVRDADRGPVADLGCGPGRQTDYLTRQGLSAFGIDLSPKMIELAREAFPSIRFTVGSMTALDIGDDQLGGILAFYSTHHTPPEWLPTIYAEFHRTLAPGGYLLLGGYVGDDEHLRPTRGHGGHPVSYESYLLPVDRIVTMLRESGLVVTAVLREEPDGRTKRPHGCLLARKPDQP